MKKQLIIASSTVLMAVAFTACGDATTNTTDNKDTLQQSLNASTLTIEPFSNPTPLFEDATLGIKSITAKPLGTDSATIEINYDVKNYELGAQTPDASTLGCNNSKDGQHIHFIKNNEPYTALYKPTHTFNVALDQEYYILSFLSRSYHESLKHKGASQLLHFTVNKDAVINNIPIPETPMVFFSRPKGDYVGAVNTDKVLLDFYTINTDFSKQMVKATINGTDFVVNKWQPFFIMNTPMGELKVTLQMTDANGNVLEGPNTKVSRVANLATQEPVK